MSSANIMIAGLERAGKTMYRRPKLDLDYNHGSAAAVRQPRRIAVEQKPAMLDLTARLRGLKALFDMERRERVGDAAGIVRAR